MKVEVRGRKGRIVINPKIYSYEVVEKTKNKFQKFCHVKIKRNSKITVELEFKKKIRRKNIETLCYEFCNCLLDTIKEVKGCI